MLKRLWIMPAIVISGSLWGCSHHAATLAENDPFHGKDPFQQVAARSAAAGGAGVASVNEVPPPATTHWTSADGWRSATYVTHPEFASEPIASQPNSQVARVSMSDRGGDSAQGTGSALRNADYVVARPVSAAARIEIVSAEELEAETHPKYSVRDGIRFIETSASSPDRPDFVNDAAAVKLDVEIPPFVEPVNDFGANPFEPRPSRASVPTGNGPQNSPEWWES